MEEPPVSALAPEVGGSLGGLSSQPLRTDAKGWLCFLALSCPHPSAWEDPPGFPCPQVYMGKLRHERYQAWVKLHPSPADPEGAVVGWREAPGAWIRSAALGSAALAPRAPCPTPAAPGTPAGRAGCRAGCWL